MEFSLFAHMERLTPDQPHEVLHEEFISICKMADEGGMRAIWTGEHHGMEFTIAPNPFLSIVDLAHHTKNVRLGTGTVIAPFWHPIRLAGEAAATDLITGGRLELGIARGAYSFEYERMMPGLDAAQAGARMRETAPLLPQLWAGDCTHAGQFYSFPATTAVPKALQDGGPPIWIAAREEASHQFGVSAGFNIQVTPLWQGMEEITALKSRFDAARAENPGRSPKIMLLHHTYVGRDEEDVAQAAREISRYYCYFGAWFQNKRPVRNGLIEALSEEEIAGNNLMAPEKLARDLTIGTKQEVIDRIRRYEDMGYDEFSFWIDTGMSHQRKRDSLARFLDDVLPAFA
ncbi:LLM class flavin-dependent oxidoreductase [Alloyangia pacifica]|uniref:Flavin-dependent oxidoreductase, luciferase family (Includes alkanesulfonate monooxygenase SsuD and methylene tetrahydromethanopterin reductase) n=1 Tax=Alloyangia pacifica TaxID=311180 RepID=A0A1I6VZJ6_9RHOB|nr:LLM class flavin-dependent oxidoreductase [Alloyangia pacifica]SDI17922.1 Flavin-dependent oxidoreductase, luciferase family (includes alkanesulfonate monooxygenase SsuD and methylene tetrahydromethanopterin reductase) [Alloyangia pacifica]SFT18824.1 Flavin-dependent oxidoreductase, luciferase family (includes alkanesulfonate monooxygenase SsuD and methylene tetrahydromethanopterin reductase) [Alloyangia pacifica]